MIDAFEVHGQNEQWISANDSDDIKYFKSLNVIELYYAHFVFLMQF